MYLVAISIAIPGMLAFIEKKLFKEDNEANKDLFKRSLLIFVRILFALFLISIINHDISFLGKSFVQLIYIIIEISSYFVIRNSTLSNIEFKGDRSVSIFFAIHLLIMLTFLYYFASVTFFRNINGPTKLLLTVWISYCINLGSTLYVISKLEAKKSSTKITSTIKAIVSDSYKNHIPKAFDIFAISIIGFALILNGIMYALPFFPTATFYSKFFRTSLIQLIIVIIIQITAIEELIIFSALVFFIWNLIIAIKLKLKK